MRLRLMATYLGVPYQAGLGPDGTQATLFSPGPPAEELGFTAAGGHWRKQVSVTDLDALWQSRPVGNYRGEPCLVLDDLGDRLHVAYLGRDAARAAQLGYWEIDREVFEVVVARGDVTSLTEERVDFPLSAAMFPPPGGQAEPEAPAMPEAPVVPEAPAMPEAPAGAAATGPAGYAEPAVHAGANGNPRSAGNADFEAYRGAAVNGGPTGNGQPTGYRCTDHAPRMPDRMAAWHGSPEPWPRPQAPTEDRSNALVQERAEGRSDPESEARPGREPQLGREAWPGPEPQLGGEAWPGPEPQLGREDWPGREPQLDREAWPGPPAELRTEREPGPVPWTENEPWSDPWTEREPGSAPEMGSVPGRRAGRKDRICPESVFAELLSLAAIPEAAYAVDEEVPGAMCLVEAEDGFEVFSRTDDARLEVHFFEDEEAAYFYLFGVLAAEAIRSGRLGPKGSDQANGHYNGSGSASPSGPSPTSSTNVSKYLRGKK
jgi:hypothetical protein